MIKCKNCGHDIAENDVEKEIKENILNGLKEKEADTKNDLIFNCSFCTKSVIRINTRNDMDKNRLWLWLKKHNKSGNYGLAR